MPVSRPIRQYQHTFKHGTFVLVIETPGGTPCAAKNLAYVLFERQLAAQVAMDPSLPSTGWVLFRQDDITYRINASPPVS